MQKENTRDRRMPATAESSSKKAATAAVTAAIPFVASFAPNDTTANVLQSYSNAMKRTLKAHMALTRQNPADRQEYSLEETLKAMVPLFKAAGRSSAAMPKAFKEMIALDVAGDAIAVTSNVLYDLLSQADINLDSYPFGLYRAHVPVGKVLSEHGISASGGKHPLTQLHNLRTFENTFLGAYEPMESLSGRSYLQYLGAISVADGGLKEPERDADLLKKLHKSAQGNRRLGEDAFNDAVDAYAGSGSGDGDGGEALASATSPEHPLLQGDVIAQEKNALYEAIVARTLSATAAVRTATAGSMTGDEADAAVVAVASMAIAGTLCASCESYRDFMKDAHRRAQQLNISQSVAEDMTAAHGASAEQIDRILTQESSAARDVVQQWRWNSALGVLQLDTPDAVQDLVSPWPDRTLMSFCHYMDEYVQKRATGAFLAEVVEATAALAVEIVPVQCDRETMLEWAIAREAAVRAKLAALQDIVGLASRELQPRIDLATALFMNRARVAVPQQMASLRSFFALLTLYCNMVQAVLDGPQHAVDALAGVEEANSAAAAAIEALLEHLREHAVQAAIDLTPPNQQQQQQQQQLPEDENVARHRAAMHALATLLLDETSGTGSKKKKADWSVALDHSSNSLRFTSGAVLQKQQQQQQDQQGGAQSSPQARIQRRTEAFRQEQYVSGSADNTPVQQMVHAMFQLRETLQQEHVAGRDEQTTKRIGALLGRISDALKLADETDHRQHLQHNEYERNSMRHATAVAFKHLRCLPRDLYFKGKADDSSSSSGSGGGGDDKAYVAESMDDNERFHFRPEPFDVIREQRDEVDAYYDKVELFSEMNSDPVELVRCFSPQTAQLCVLVGARSLHALLFEWIAKEYQASASDRHGSEASKAVMALLEAHAGASRLPAPAQNERGAMASTARAAAVDAVLRQPELRDYAGLSKPISAQAQGWGANRWDILHSVIAFARLKAGEVATITAAKELLSQLREKLAKDVTSTQDEFAALVGITSQFFNPTQQDGTVTIKSHLPGVDVKLAEYTWMLLKCFDPDEVEYNKGDVVYFVASEEEEEEEEAAAAAEAIGDAKTAIANLQAANLGRFKRACLAIVELETNRPSAGTTIRIADADDINKTKTLRVYTRNLVRASRWEKLVAGANGDTVALQQAFYHAVNAAVQYIIGVRDDASFAKRVAGWGLGLFGRR